TGSKGLYGLKAIKCCFFQISPPTAFTNGPKEEVLNYTFNPRDIPVIYPGEGKPDPTVFCFIPMAIWYCASMGTEEWRKWRPLWMLPKLSSLPWQMNIWAKNSTAPTMQFSKATEIRSEEHMSELQSREDLVCRL